MGQGKVSYTIVCQVRCGEVSYDGTQGSLTLDSGLKRKFGCE